LPMLAKSIQNLGIREIGIVHALESTSGIAFQGR